VIILIYFLSILLCLHIVTFLKLVMKSHIESVDSVCRDSVDLQYKNLKNCSKLLFYTIYLMTSVGRMVNGTPLVTGG